VLRFRRAGGPWPASEMPGSAGEVTITLEHPGTPLVLPLPTTADGALRVMLPRGHHAVRLQLGRGSSFDPLTYPSSTLQGELTVERAGEAIIDVPSTPLTFDVRLGGQPFPVPKVGESVALRLEGRYGLPGIDSNLFNWKRAAGQALEKRTVWLEPGKYTVVITTEGAVENPSLPSGYDIVTRFLEIGSEPLERTFDVPMVKLSGDLTINGKDLPASARAEVDLAAKDAVARAVVATARPAHYEVLAFAGTYDVSLATDTGAEASGVPFGAVKVFPAKTLEQDLVAGITATSLPWSATLTVNGAALPDAARDRGTLLIDGAISHEFALGKTGPAMAMGPVFLGGPSTVKVVGAAGGVLPLAPTPVATGFTPSSTSAQLDLKVATLTIGLSIDGRDPDPAPARGSFRLTRADDATISFRAPATTEGPLQAVVPIAPGTWRVVFQSGGAAGLPAGEVSLGDLTVPPEGLTRSFPVKSLELVVEIRRNGGSLPDATAGKDRGAVQVGDARVPLPTTGPARVSVRAFAGVTAVSVVCQASCGAGLPPFLTVAPRVRVAAP
jgi:hypothetical protein